MNSFTSRPRSPIRPTTMMSASVKRVIMPSSHTLAHAGTGEEPEALATAHGQQTIDAANAHVQRAG